ncbi:hydrogenase maturation protease [Nocardioides aquiterrae]|uniref:Hydrogenase maturation protease n=1 Tax=Nocardioides aquiterrae TaxID=203799 RepID=A0ABN1UFU9_9ACTN
MTGPLVIGLGAPDRGDDAVGAAVAGAVATRLAGIAVVAHEDPTGLLDVWAGHSPVVVVDAVRTGAPPGTVHRLETGTADRPIRAGHGSTHALGLAEVVELARALGRLPERLVVVGVEADRFDHGAPLSPAVAAAVPVAVRRVCEELGHVPR